MSYPEITPNFAWSDAFLLGYTPIDDEHREFVAAIRALIDASDAELVSRLEAFAAVAKAHFDSENALMEQTEFPPRECHMDEHAAVMRSVAEVRPELAAGNIQAARGLGAALENWFPGHADYLDSALAQWMCKRALGGKPVVLRRNILTAP
jgi:hemerythrin